MPLLKEKRFGDRLPEGILWTRGRYVNIRGQRMVRGEELYHGQRNPLAPEGCHLYLRAPEADGTRGQSQAQD